MSDGPNLDAYLKRINYAGSIAPTIETLQMLHRLHPVAIPFENLDPLMEQPVRLGLSDLEQKLVVERRGGYCFEHNLLLKAVLEDMDFKVTQLAARVASVQGDDVVFAETPNHMVLLVDVGGLPFLADVGLGRQVMTAPLRLKADLEQGTPNERYRLTGGQPVWQLESEATEGWRPLFQFDLTPATLDDYTAMNDAAQLRFKDDLLASRVDGSKRHGLRNARLRTHDGAEVTTRTLANVGEIRDALTGVFGIALPQSDRLDPALEKALLAWSQRLMAPFVVNEDAVFEFKDLQALNRWYAKHHAKAPEMWIKIHKKGSGLPSVTNVEGFEEALCWGWIDAIRKPFDGKSFLQRYTPRGKKSIWSTRNQGIVERLIKDSRMQPSGQAQIELAKADGRWAKAYGGFSKDKFPADLMAAIAAEPKALKMFETLNAQNRYALGFRTHNMKTATGREKIAGFVDMLRRGETIYPNGKTK